MNVLGLVCSLLLSFMMASSNNSPSARAVPFIASAGNLVYLWGGRGDTEPEAVFLFHRDTKAWARQRTRGPHPPAGLHYGGCCISGQHLYIYGGRDVVSRHGGLYELNTNSWTWRQLSDGDTGGPGKKNGCRIIPYQDQLLVVGGLYDEMPNSRQAGASYEGGMTNEIHSFNLTTGQWSFPSMKGSRPPPCVAFSLTLTDKDQAVMFGGYTSSINSSEAHVLHLPTMTWYQFKEGDPWPEGRWGHIAVCLGYGGQHKTVLISGGWNGNVTLDDMWLLDPQSGRMEEVQVPGKHKKLVQRREHGAVTLTVNSDCVEVILFGGYDKNFSLTADTTILKFVRQTSAPEGVSPAQRWILLDPGDANASSERSCKRYWPIFLSVAVPILAVLLIIVLSMSSKQDVIPTTEPAKYLLRDSRPRIQDLLFLRCGSKELEIISEVASKCNTFGYLLNLNRHTVKTEWDIPGASVHSKCQDIVDHWLDGKGTKGKHGKPVTWMTLIEALREFGKHWLADSLEKCIN